MALVRRSSNIGDLEVHPKAHSGVGGEIREGLPAPTRDSRGLDKAPYPLEDDSNCIVFRDAKGLFGDMLCGSCRYLFLIRNSIRSLYAVGSCSASVPGSIQGGCRLPTTKGGTHLRR